MKRLSKIVLGCSLLAATPAFADDATGAPAPDPATPPPTAPAATVSASAEVGVGLIAAEHTLPKAKVLVYGDFDIANASNDDGMGGSTSATLESIHIGGAYGVSDVLTVGGEYSADVAGDTLDGTNFKGPLRLFGEYKLKHDEKMSMSIEGDFEINLCGTVDLTGTDISCSATEALGATFNARYAAAPKVAIFTGNPVGPGVAGGTGALVFGGFGSKGIGDQLRIGLNNDQPVALAIPVGVGVQAAPKVFIYAETILATIFFSNGPQDSNGDSKTAIFIGSDDQGIPLQAGAYFSANPQLDIGVTFLDDLKHAGDLYVIGLAGRYHL